jgi:hypothetical protein
MKLFATLLLTLSLLQISAQSKKPPAKTASATSTTAMSMAQANAIIDYVNHLEEFIRTKWNVDYLREQLNTLNEQANGKSRNFNSLSRLSNNYKPFQDLVNDYKDGNEGYVITNVPAACGIPCKTKITKHLELVDQQLKEMDATAGKAKELVDGSNSFKKEGSYEQAIAEVDKLNQIYLKASASLDSIYDETAELGFRGEEVTLAKHPMKTEIFDMKRSLKMAREVLVMMSASEKPKVESFYPEVDKKIGQLKTYMTKYENYNTKSKGISQEQSRTQVKEFFERTAKFCSQVEVIKKSFAEQKKTAFGEPAAPGEQDALATLYDLVLSDFNSFVNSNNDR